MSDNNGDVRAALAQVRSILDDIERDLPPRALRGQEDYDAIVSPLKEHGCPAAGACEECAFGIPGVEDCPQTALREMLARMRGHEGRS